MIYQDTSTSSSSSSSTSSFALLSKFRIMVPTAIREITTQMSGREMGHNYEPSEVDIFCGRGKGFYNRPGNKKFRTLVNAYIPAYLAAKSKVDKSAVLNTIVDKVREVSDPATGRTAQFIKFSKKTGWVEIGDDQAREKVGHAMREAISSSGQEEDEPTTTSRSIAICSNNPKKALQQKPPIECQPTPLAVYSAHNMSALDESSTLRRQDSIDIELDVEPFLSDMAKHTLTNPSLLWGSSRRGSGRSSFISRDSMSSEMMRAAIESFIGV